jgi:hypothetical protein
VCYQLDLHLFTYDLFDDIFRGPVHTEPKMLCLSLNNEWTSMNVAAVTIYFKITILYRECNQEENDSTPTHNTASLPYS